MCKSGYFYPIQTSHLLAPLALSNQKRVTFSCNLIHLLLEQDIYICMLSFLITASYFSSCCSIETYAYIQFHATIVDSEVLFSAISGLVVAPLADSMSTSWTEWNAYMHMQFNRLMSNIIVSTIIYIACIHPYIHTYNIRSFAGWLFEPDIFGFGW